MEVLPPKVEEECKIGETVGSTPQQLENLKKDVDRLAGLGLTRTNFTIPGDRPILPGESPKGIVNSIFAMLKTPISGTAAADRVELAFTTNKVNLIQLKATQWELKDGQLTFKNDAGVGVLVIDLLPWDAVINREPETEEAVAYNEYELGNYEGGVNKSRDGTVRLIGSADATPILDKAKSLKWYTGQAHAADTLLKLFADQSRFAMSSVPLVLAVQKQLTELASLKGSTNVADFRRVFESHFTKDEIFGARGVYNLVLAFQRLLNVSNLTPAQLLESKVLIELTIGTAVHSQKDRFSKAVAIKGGATEFGPDTVKICKTPEKPPKPPEDPKEHTPFDPEEMIEEILKIKHGKFDIGRKAIHKGGWVVTAAEKEMTIGHITNGGVDVEGFFIIDRAAPQNPKHYLVMDRGNPYSIGVGFMEYPAGLLISDDAERGPLAKLFPLDATSRTATRAALNDLLNNLP